MHGHAHGVPIRAFSRSLNDWDDTHTNRRLGKLHLACMNIARRDCMVDWSRAPGCMTSEYLGSWRNTQHLFLFGFLCFFLVLYRCIDTRVAFGATACPISHTHFFDITESALSCCSKGLYAPSPNPPNCYSVSRASSGHVPCRWTRLRYRRCRTAGFDSCGR